MKLPSICKKSAVSPSKSSVFSLQSSVSRRRQAAGFTLLELLIVIALIMVLMGLLIPAFYKVKDRAKANKRDIELRVLTSAIAAYKIQEKKFPAPVDDLTGGVDRWYGADEADNPLAGGNNNEVMDILKDAVPPVFDTNKLRWDGDGNVIDPYDNQYKIWMDLDYSDYGVGFKVEYLE